MSTDNIRVRFAPSPTGFLHIGGARTALYNYLFARKNNGTFILRIEDTDSERSVSEFLDTILDSLGWLGLTWDEGPKKESGELIDSGDYGPYLQSRRRHLYDEALNRLIEADKVYKCYCSPEELKVRREEALKAGRDPGYDGTCLRLTEEQKRSLEEKDAKYAYRIKNPSEGSIVFDDMIKGNIEIGAATINDFVVAKSGGMPTYNFACAVDDHNMKITHIIRGDDHIYNTPKQILIYNALGWDIPRYAHLPQVHGTDGKKLSKRTGAVSVEEYREKGYLPEALRNYLALIGWSTQDSQQLFKWDELIDKFDLAGCSSSRGIFDVEKLNWMNGKYIRDMSPGELVDRSSGWLKEAGLDGYDSKSLLGAVELEQEKFEFLTDIPKRIDILVKDDIEYDEKSVGKRLRKEGVRGILLDIKKIFLETGDFSAKVLEDKIRVYCETNGLGAGKVYHPVRVAVSGRMQGPGIFELLEFIGKDRVIERIDHTLNNIVQ